MPNASYLVVYTAQSSTGGFAVAKRNSARGRHDCEGKLYMPVRGASQAQWLRSRDASHAGVRRGKKQVVTVVIKQGATAALHPEPEAILKASPLPEPYAGMQGSPPPTPLRFASGPQQGLKCGSTKSSNKQIGFHLFLRDFVFSSFATQLRASKTFFLYNRSTSCCSFSNRIRLTALMAVEIGGVS